VHKRGVCNVFEDRGVGGARCWEPWVLSGCLEVGAEGFENCK